MIKCQKKDEYISIKTCTWHILNTRIAFSLLYEYTCNMSKNNNRIFKIGSARISQRTTSKIEPKTIKTIFSFWGMFLISECLCKLWNVICIVISPFGCVIKIYSSHTIHNSPHAINNNIIHSVKIFFISFYNSGWTCCNIMVFNACVYLYGADIFSYELACRLLSGHVYCF